MNKLRAEGKKSVQASCHIKGRASEMGTATNCECDKGEKNIGGRNKFRVLKKREEQRLEAAQMKFLRHLVGITKLDKERNQCIRQKTGAQNIVKEIKQYQEKWLQHVQRMDTNRPPK